MFVSASTDGSSFGGDLRSAFAQLGGLASIVGLGATVGRSDTEEALAVLRSRQFIDRFIEDHGLLPILYSSSWDPATATWRVGVRPPTAAKAHKAFLRMTAVEVDRDSGLMTLRVDWKDGEQAALWANSLIQQLNEEMRARAIEQAGAMLAYLEAELVKTSVVEMRAAINSLIEAQVKQRMLANVTREYAFRVVDPAMPPDIDEPIKPRKRVMVAIGAVVGVGLGLVLTFFLAYAAGDFSRNALARSRAMSAG